MNSNLKESCYSSNSSRVLRLLKRAFSITTDPIKDLKNSQGKLISANIFFIMLTTLLLILTYNTRLRRDGQEPDLPDEFVIRISGVFCRIIGYSLYGAGISMFYWMTVLCLDLFWTLTKSSPSNHHQRTGRFRFCCYFLFGCGMPLIQTLTIFILDHWETGVLKPGKHQHFSCLKRTEFLTNSKIQIKY